MRKQKKLLIAGGGYADIPLIKSAQALGYEVITSGNRADDAGHKVSDIYAPGDYSDPEAMLQIARDHAIDAVCACCNDFSALSVAFVAEKLGLPGHDAYQTALLIHHKDKYRKFALENGINSPYAKAFREWDLDTSQLDQFNYPILIKPVDLTGGKGIIKIDQSDDILPALQYATERSKQDTVVLEEFVDGSRHGFSTFLVGGKVVFYFSDNEHYFNNPYMVSGASTPSSVSCDIEKLLCKQIEKIANLLAMVDGIVHVQYILHDDTPIIIEICRRAPGDLYVRFVEIATGVPYPLWIIKAAAGEPLNDIWQVDVKGCYMRHCVMSKHKGRFTRISINRKIKPHIIESIMLMKTGDIIENETIQKMGIIMLQFDSRKEMAEFADKMPELIKPEVEPIN